MTDKDKLKMAEEALEKARKIADKAMIERCRLKADFVRISHTANKALAAIRETRDE